MDPITATTTLITLASFITDLIEVGQSIKSSIEKVGENRRRIRDLTNDVLRTLADLANLTRGQEDAFQAPALLSALGNLKAEMLYVLSICREISPVQRPGFRGFGSQIKVWMRRDDVEKKIECLKEHVNTCYIQFTAFSTARIETTTGQIVNSTLRVEQTLIVNNMESQVKLRRLEGMMARVLLETKFGQNVLNQTMEIIAADSTHKSLESRYLSVQTMRLIESLQKLWVTGDLSLANDFQDPEPYVHTVFVEPTCTSDVLHAILGAVRDLKNGFTAIDESIMINLGVYLGKLQMVSEGIAWHLLQIRILRDVARNNESEGILAHLASSLTDLSHEYGGQRKFETALEAGQQALDLYTLLAERFPGTNSQTMRSHAMILHALILILAGQNTAALAIAEQAVTMARPIFDQMIETCPGRPSLSQQDQFRAVTCRECSFALAIALSSVDRHLESYGALKEGFQTAVRLPTPPRSLGETNIDLFINKICKVAEGGGLSLCMLADCVILFRALARAYPGETSSQWLALFHAYMHFSQQDHSSDTILSLENIHPFLEPNSDSPPPAFNIAMRVDFSLLGEGIVEDVVRAYYTRPSHTFVLLMRNIFVTHFEQAVAVLRQTVEGASPGSNTIAWALHSIADIVPLVSRSERMDLLQMMTKPIQHLGTILAHWRVGPRWFYDFILTPTFLHLWSVGLLDDALAASNEVIEYFCSCSNTHQ